MMVGKLKIDIHFFFFNFLISGFYSVKIFLDLKITNFKITKNLLFYVTYV